MLNTFLLGNTLIILVEVWAHFRKVLDLFRDIPKLTLVCSKRTTLHIRSNSLFSMVRNVLCC